MGSSGINAVHGEPKARGNPVAIREPGHGSLSWPSRERYVKVPCDRKVARRKATRPGEADRRSKSRVICSGWRPTIPTNRSERRQGNGRVEKTPEPRGFCGVSFGKRKISLKTIHSYKRSKLAMNVCKNSSRFDHLFLCILLLPHVLLHIHHFFSLPLTTSVSSESLLAELQCSLVFVQLQQFHAPLLVRCKSCHISHQVPHECGLARLLLFFAFGHVVVCWEDISDYDLNISDYM